MLDYMKKMYGNRLGYNEGERQELHFLKEEVPKLKGVIRQQTMKAG
jgi:hypothetical protein